MNAGAVPTLDVGTFVSWATWGRKGTEETVERTSFVPLSVSRPSPPSPLSPTMPLLRLPLRASIMAGMVEPIWRSVEPSAEAPLQFGIRDLMIAQAICAVSLGLFATIGIFALLAIFVATFIFCCIRVPPARKKLKRCIIDLMGGVFLPAMCLVYDPGIFFDTPGDRVTAIGLLAVVFEMLILLMWMIVGRYVGRWSALFSGMLWVGAVVAGVIGVLLSLFSLIGIVFFGIGLLGFTPFLTCVVFVRNARDAARRARDAGGKWEVVPLFMAGFVLAAAIPCLMQMEFGTWIATTVQSLPRPHGRWMDNVLPHG
jgi:hypothetical protein